MIKAVNYILLLLFSLLIAAGCSEKGSSSSGGIPVGEIIYTVAFDGNGAESGSMESISALKGHQISLPDNVFIKTGYRFTGWSESADGQVKYINQSYITVTSNITLYAVWEKIDSAVTSYTITLLSGYDNTSYSYTAEYDKPFMLPDSLFQREGYTFAGWSDKKDGEIVYKANEEVVINKDITLYALWQSSGEIIYHTVTLYAESGDSKPLVYSIEHNSSFYLPNEPFIKAGYYFEGWAETVNGTKKYNNQDTITVSSDIELYALWHERDMTSQYYYITFYANNGTDEKNNTSITNGSVFYPNFNRFKKEGYVFLGWSENPDAYEAAYSDGEIFTPLKDMELYAVWALESDTYTVTFNINGGNEFFKDPESLSARKGSYIVLPSLENFKHTSLVPKGYALNPDETSNYLSAGSRFYPDKNTTLYLIWGDGSQQDFALTKQWIYGIDIKDSDWVNISQYDPEIVLWESGKSNWYDIYQHYNELCWAASSSNIFLWWYNINKEYIDRYIAENGYNGPAFTYDGQGSSPIYLYYKENWEDIGNNPIAALHWFLQGSSLRPGGGFFADVYTNKTYTSTSVLIKKGHFNQILTDVLKNQKAALLQITTTGTHVVTFWGAEYDENGFIKRVFITDSATKNTSYNGKWGDLTVADIEYIDDTPYIFYNGYPASVVEKIYIFSLGIDIWKEYYNEK